MKRFIYIIIFFIAAVACEKQENIHFREGDTVECTINVGLDNQCLISMDENSLKSKSIVDNNEIKNLWIMQYDGTGDDAKLIGTATYISNFAEFNGEIKLVVTKSASTIYLVANTFEDEKSDFAPGQTSTLGDLKARTKVIKSQNDLMGYDKTNHHPIFNGSYKIPQIIQGLRLNLTLQRNIAKVSISIKNETTGTETIVLDSVKLCSIPEKSYYITDIATMNFPQTGTFNTISYDKVIWGTTENKIELNYYLPANIRGVGNSTSQISKNMYAPKEATNVKVYGHYTQGNEEFPIIYTFYLGGNMYNDFNIKPNYKYSYNFTISNRGDSKTDSRVERWDMVDYSNSQYPLANSYILNPIPAGNAKRTFRIPIQRIFTFWGSEGRNLYENDPTLSLRENDGKWKAFFLAKEMVAGDVELVEGKSSGNKEDNKYFEVKVAPGSKGNVIVAVGPDDGTSNKVVSWSWHLWITDYNPEECLRWGNGTTGQYIYPVVNGQVHRYEGGYWFNNKNVYIMDRNLGAFSNNMYPLDEYDEKELLYYQFGRKDPIFPTKHTNIENSINNTENAVLYTIKNPLVFIKGIQLGDNDYSTWNKGNKYNPDISNSSMIWYDPTTVEGGINEGKKSIFDPCPPGYRVPSNTVWSDFRSHDKLFNDKGELKQTWTTNSFTNKTNETELKDSDYHNNFKPYNEVKGLQYWPYQGPDVNIPDNPIYIPGSGLLVAGNGGHSHHGNVGTLSNITGNNTKECWSFLWADALENVNDAYGYTSQKDYLKAMNTADHSRGLPVRCITDRK